jgi:ATP-dependent DNA helicase RecG
MASLFEKNIQELKGVGEKRAKLFCKLGVPTAGALLRFYPRNYEDWSNPYEIAQAPVNGICSVRASIVSGPTEHRIRGGMTLYKVTVTDGISDMMITFFNNPYIKNLLAVDKEYLFYGKISGYLLRREMSAPEFAPADKCPPVHPIYRQTGGLTSKMIENAVKTAFTLLPRTIRDPIPDNILHEVKLCPLRFALENIHFPKSMEDLAAARRRLIFEEFLVLQLGLLRLKGRSREETRLRLTKDSSDEFFSLLPFQPTNAQRRAVAEAVADMRGA